MSLLIWLLKTAPWSCPMGQVIKPRLTRHNPNLSEGLQYKQQQVLASSLASSTWHFFALWESVCSKPQGCAKSASSAMKPTALDSLQVQTAKGQVGNAESSSQCFPSRSSEASLQSTGLLLHSQQLRFSKVFSPGINIPCLHRKWKIRRSERS